VVWVLKIKWTAAAIEHIARHGVTRAEVEDVVFGERLATQARNGRYRFVGQTHGGRYLTVIFVPREETMRELGVSSVVTARDATDQERRAFRRY
jgi:uncharacterized DUF497 family protein